MSRIKTAPAKGLFRKYYFREVRRRFGRDLETTGVMAHHTHVMTAVGGFELAMERAKKVPEQLKNLAETKVALVVGCEFCIDIGSHISSESGISDEQLLALPRHREATCFSELEKLVLDYAEAMTQTPAAVGDDLFAALQEHFDEAQLVELTTMIAWENWRARFNWAFGLGPAGFRDGAACPVPLHEEQAAAVA